MKKDNIKICVFKILGVFIASFLLCSMSRAQTAQYQRVEPQKKNAEKTENKKEEVDISEIEKKYWVAKDSDFQVVQNRLYTKAKRISVSGSMGSLINDSFSDATPYNFNIDYFLSERWGFGANFMSMNPDNNSMTEEFISRFGVAPNFNKFRRYYGLAVNWVPIYAKASLLGKKIMYYDFFISAGLGLAQYEQQFTDKGNETQTTPALALDFVQQFFLTNHWAVRFAYQMRFYSHEVLDSRSPFEVREDALETTNVLSLGVTYFF